VEEAGGANRGNTNEWGSSQLKGDSNIAAKIGDCRLWGGKLVVNKLFAATSSQVAAERCTGVTADDAVTLLDAGALEN